MKVLILGLDGYLGWSLAKHLGRVHRDWELAGVDCFKRRDWVASVGAQSGTPIARMTDRLEAYVDAFERPIRFYRGDVCDWEFVREVFRSFKPDAVVHLAEQPSAPYSMMGPAQACETHRNNLEGTLNVLFAIRDYAPDAHLLKLGTMGEYGTPGVDIPEGEFVLEYRGRSDKALFPRRPGSLYHATKVHDTHNVHLACRAWGIRSTDIMQGVVYGVSTDSGHDGETDPRMYTRFDFDAVFGTAINRFCAQSVAGAPITVYGTGEQRRGFLPLQDSMACLTLALENPPDGGEYRTFNQFEEVYSINELARTVVEAAKQRSGVDTEIVHISNPRMGGEVAGEHYYNPDRLGLVALGYLPGVNMKAVIKDVLHNLYKHRLRIKARAHTFLPQIMWDGSRATE